MRYAHPNEKIVTNSQPLRTKAQAMISVIADFDTARADDLQEWIDQYDLDMFRARALNMQDVVERLDIAMDKWYARLIDIMREYAAPFTTLEVRDGWIGFWLDRDYAQNVSKHFCDKCGTYAKFDDLRILHDQDTESLMYHTNCMYIIETTVYAPGHEHPRNRDLTWYDVGAGAV